MDRVPALRRAILVDVPPLRAALWALLAVVVPTALRASINASIPGSGFVSYSPAIALAALFLGWRWGVAVAVVSTAVANRLFGQTPFWEVLAGPDWPVIPLFALSCTVLIVTGDMCRRLVRELEAAKARETILNAELLHRVKNMLATVNAMAILTARHTEPERFSEAFGGRMKALERATDLLAAGESGHCEIHRLVAGAIEPFRTERNFAIEGPSCELPRDACVPLALALHELCTNAAKHGALSADAGQVDLRWTLGEDEDGLLRMVWREHGGPPVPEVRRAGMGTQLLRRQNGLERVEVAFPPDGLCCEIAVAGCVQLAERAAA